MAHKWSWEGAAPTGLERWGDVAFEDCFLSALLSPRFEGS